ncbi:DNA mismatch repair protein MutS2 [Sedimentibacter acidaminivorans]|uniref:Endonuclease MutS2 n=1 Tax=Sedimentibacter acidaminivorans TaxID=913099 RepID=A0ABS4GHY2_9FIRM|nr:endonuclease MutS2 [Sedimentibacter acidaminivorans]MBP1927227.1 DNA mismatch repair protein MutS2 [Sedimentibacter acidaminivorans]
MKQKSKVVLEFNKIIESVESFAETETGKKEVRKLDISSDIERVNYLQNQTKEALSIIIEKGSPPLGGISDVRDYVKRGAVGGIISQRGLLNCADTLRAARLMKNYVLLNNKEERKYEILEELCQTIYSNKDIEDKIYSIIISEEEIADDASSELKRIRRAIQIKNSAIKNKINSIVNSSTTQKYLQESIVTMRNDRYVVPVKKEYRSMIKGIMHDQSSTGSTIYIEPIAIVEMNNEVSNLKIEEKKEVERILLELSLMIGDIEREMIDNQQLLTQLDFIFAKGKYAISINAIEPKINDKGYIRIKNGRHPLIDSNVVVPINVWLGDEFTTLIITGPNTGGKTVAIKTIGLFSLMGMSGLHIPAEYGTEISLFSGVFADIGDEQSIEQSLSTFSSHMTNIVKIMKEVDDKSLVLFDELGAGTDPTEGAALAISILDKLHDRKIITAATTHYSELKLHALTTDGVCNGSVEFNVETLSPTYKLLIGVPGKSNAFEISKKLGLDESIIQKAKSTIETEKVEFEDALNQIEKNRIYIEEKKSEIDRLSSESQKKHADFIAKERKALEKSEKLINEANYEARKIVEQTKRETAEIIKELKKLNLEMNKDKSRRVNELRQNLNNKTKVLEENPYTEQIFEEETYDTTTPLKKGDAVNVKSLNQKGYVLSDEDDSQNVMVQIGIMKTKVKKSDLIKIKSDDEKNYNAKTSRIIKLKTTSISSTIDVRGENLEEALMEIDKYLDDAFMSNLNEIQIIHGKGMGILREGITQFLKKNKHVKDFRLGNFNEGGDGVTIVTFK